MTTYFFAVTGAPREWSVFPPPLATTRNAARALPLRAARALALRAIAPRIVPGPAAPAEMRAAGASTVWRGGMPREAR